MLPQKNKRYVSKEYKARNEFKKIRMDGNSSSESRYDIKLNDKVLKKAR